MKKILILGAGSIQVPVIKKAKELGFYTISLDFNPRAEGIDFADEFHIISTNDTEKVLELARKSQINGILTTSDFPVNVVAEVSKKLGLAAMSVEIAELCTNKYLQREFFRKNNINTPKYKLIKSIEDLDTIDFFPCVIKPVDSSASRGVKKVTTQAELFEQYPLSKVYAKSGTVIVEEFVKGREFSVETLTQGNVTSIIQITEKLTLGEEYGYFVEDTHIAPARITSIELRNIENTVKHVISEMKANNCPTHTELKLNKDGVFIIEIACRLGGDYITSDLVPLSTGVDMLENLILISIGEKIDVTKTRHNTSLIQFLSPINYDRCIKFIDSKNDFIVRSEVYEYSNNEVKNSSDRLGYIILCTPTLFEMEKLLKQIK